ncbi:MAG: 4Fe-4S binding protein [Nitrospira sp.]|nr:4Fe-4S binding protein [bacterium]MBL7049551.1 4Fe-4S binding protein [Nitrospira sp.]
MIQNKIAKVGDIKTIADLIKCPVEKASTLITGFLSGPMCGKCFPCSMGSYEARTILNDLMEGNGTASEFHNLKRIAAEMLESSMCKKGKDIAAFVTEYIDEEIFNSHVNGICPSQTCKNLIEYKVIADKCTMCGLCKDACKYNAIHGEKAVPFRSSFYPFDIRQTKCVTCGECIKVCPVDAIILVDAKDAQPVSV